jgi:hypothetical protein
MRVYQSLDIPDAKFPTGNIKVTNYAYETLYANSPDKTKVKEFIFDFVRRHAQGDWGDVDEYGRNLNEAAIILDLPIRSIYVLPDMFRIWVITQTKYYGKKPLTKTTVLLPYEYLKMFTSGK